ncbi:methyltransferase [Actinomadura syzygii]|uniref:O-methyltransferase family protein n=1 Tax=Actinomadura syzygii TaxID=1427538 RepID=A0A5D0U9H7_9ACTN|nr:methyltransferase [Actinomadura syzygii]TYC14366.1 O-methyltransferase family protein [Actinomadura syzygii]
MRETLHQSVTPNGAWGDTELRRRADLALPMAIRVAATLRLADHISDDGSSPEELAAHLRVNPDALNRLLRYLATEGILANDTTGRYRLTPLGKPLRENHPQSVRKVLDTEGALGRAELTFVELLHTVRTGQPAYATRYGSPHWQDMDENPHLAADFDTLMSTRMTACLPAITQAFEWESLGHIVDVGGGNGRLLATLLTEFPLLRGTLIEQPGPATTARAFLAKTGVADRSQVAEGDFFGPLPPKAGAYILANVLHNWDDQSCLTILHRCREASDDSGRVLIIEHLRTEGSAPKAALDLRMLLLYGGSQRGLPEMAHLATTTGLQIHNTHPAGELTILELHPTARPNPIRREEDDPSAP